jgi:hypothetical protein
MKMYKTDSYGGELIKEVYPVKVSDKSIWFKNGRSALRSNYSNYWHTIKEAKEHLTKKYKHQKERAERQLEHAKSRLKELEQY